MASAVGLDEARGDVLTLKSLEFQELPLADGSLVSAGILPGMGAINLMSLIQTGVLAVVALVLGLFVIRPILSPGRRPALPAPDTTLALPPAQGFGGPMLEGEVDPGLVYDGYGEAAPSSDEAGMDPATRLRRLIEARQTESIEILRSWMEDEEEHA